MQILYKRPDHKISIQEVAKKEKFDFGFGPILDEAGSIRFPREDDCGVR